MSSGKVEVGMEFFIAYSQVTLTLRNARCALVNCHAATGLLEDHAEMYFPDTEVAPAELWAWPRRSR